MYVVPFMRYSASNNGVILKLRVGVVQDHWEWCRSIDHNYTTFYWSAIVSIAACYTILKLLTLNNRDLEKVTEGHSNCYYSKDWVRFPICLP